MTSHSLENLTAFAARLAAAARAETLPRFRAGGEVNHKAGARFDPVTDADREAERTLRRLIAAHYPDHGVIGEEFGSDRPEADWRWVLDPVDGTRAFICGATSWTTLIALEHAGKPVIGLIDQPFTDERWTSADGRTLYQRGDSKRAGATSGLEDLSRARVSTTDPRSEGYFTVEEASAFAAVAAAARVARFSLDAYAYGLLAIGEIDIVIEASLNHHDYAALIPVVEGSGGVITGWRGESPARSERGRILASAGPALHAAALALIQSSLGG